MKHLLPPERRFDFAVVACSAWPRPSPLVFTTSTPAPTEALSPACAWVLTLETSESLHLALGRTPCFKKHQGASRAWRTQVVAWGDTASDLVSLRLHASAVCAACTAVAAEHAVASLRTALVMQFAVHVVRSTPRCARSCCVACFLWNTKGSLIAGGGPLAAFPLESPSRCIKMPKT